MKTIIIIIFIIVIIIILAPAQAQAHLPGQPPFFKINNQYANLYPVPLTSLSDFNLPQDLAPQNYLVNQSLHFELDVSQLPAPPEVVKKTKFNWDFGDGQKGQGLKQDHNYQKMGSYILDVFADDGTTPTPQLIEKVLINILPDTNYQLPQAVIKINGKQSKDPLTDILKFKFGEEIKFDATESFAGSGKIVSYLWDFGDQQSETNPTTTHTYPKDLTQAFPVLRIKDSNGFIADAYVEVQNQNQGLSVQSALNKNGSSSQQTKQKNTSQLPLTIGVILVLLIVIFMARKFFRGLDRGGRR